MLPGKLCVLIISSVIAAITFQNISCHASDTSTAGERTLFQPPIATTPAQAEPGLEMRAWPVKREFINPEIPEITCTLYNPQTVIGASFTGRAMSPTGVVKTLSFREGSAVYPTPASGVHTASLRDPGEDGLWSFEITATDGGGRAATGGYRDPEVPGDDSKMARSTLPPFKVTKTITAFLKGYARGVSPPPARIADLYVELKADNCAKLTWTLPPGTGPDSFYVVGISRDPIKGEDGICLLYRGHYTAGNDAMRSHEQCGLTPGFWYLAVRTEAPDGTKSSWSNDFAIKCGK